MQQEPEPSDEPVPRIRRVRRALLAVLTAAVAGGGILLHALNLTIHQLPRATYAEARDVVDRRCVECHSAMPAKRAFPTAPKGVVLDTGEQMQHYAQRVKVRVVVERTMPLANMTGMLEAEREILGGWIEGGARLP